MLKWFHMMRWIEEGAGNKSYVKIKHFDFFKLNVFIKYIFLLYN